MSSVFPFYFYHCSRYVVGMIFSAVVNKIQKANTEFYFSQSREIGQRYDNMDNMNTCDCVYLSFEEACYDCVIRPWKFFVATLVNEELQKYQDKFPLMDERYAKTFLERMTATANYAIWSHYLVLVPRKTCMQSVRAAVAKRVGTFMERRQHLINKYVAPAIENTISQHFLFLTDQPHAPLTLNHSACEVCKFREHFEPFPPVNFRAWMVEKLLTDIDVLPAVRPNLAEHCTNLASLYMHMWLDAPHELRDMMGV